MGGTDIATMVAAYRAAKVKHDAAIQAVMDALIGADPPPLELVKNQADAAIAEFTALDALRRPRSRCGRSAG